MTTWPKTYTAAEAPSELLDLCQRLMPLLLAGDEPFHVGLRAQYGRARIEHVELTGAGFFVEFEVPADAPRVEPQSLAGGNAAIKVRGVEGDAGCVLFIREGVIEMLEGYVNGDSEWPEHPEVLAIENVSPLAYIRSKR